MKNPTRIYNLLLWFYPSSYRKAFGAQMMQTFIDHYDDVQKSEGHASAQFWFSIITDELQNIGRQYAVSFRERNDFLKLTASKLVASALFLVPLYIVSCMVLTKIALTVPHPHVSGIGAVVALAVLLIVLPGILSVVTSYLIASILVTLFHRTARVLLRTA
jgi:uncharacterized BrkB/YihY/UPF0761 family membrane protein